MIKIKGGITVIFFCLFLSVLQSYAISEHTETKYYLQLTNPKTGETAVLGEGAFLVFRIKSSGSIKEGIIRDITDSTLILDNGQVEISQIEVLAGSSKARRRSARSMNAIGNVLLFSGLSLLDWGWVFSGPIDYYYWPLGAGLWLTGAWLAGVGYVLNEITCPPFTDRHVQVRNYRGWEVKIKKDIVSTDPSGALSKEKRDDELDADKEVPSPPGDVPTSKPKKRIKDDVYGE